MNKIEIVSIHIYEVDLEDVEEGLSIPEYLAVENNNLVNRANKNGIGLEEVFRHIAEVKGK